MSEGAKFVPDGPVMREKPVLLMCTAGPASTTRSTAGLFRLWPTLPRSSISTTAATAASEDGLREGWNLAQWGDDVRAFCDALGIVNPIVLGASFGGMVALAYATRHPDHPSRLIPHQYRSRRRRIPGASCGKLFERFGGPEVGRAGTAAPSGRTGSSRSGLG